MGIIDFDEILSARKTYLAAGSCFQLDPFFHFLFRRLTVLLEYAYLIAGVTNERPSKNICSKVCTPQLLIDSILTRTPCSSVLLRTGKSPAAPFVCCPWGRWIGNISPSIVFTSFPSLSQGNPPFFLLFFLPLFPFAPSSLLRELISFLHTMCICHSVSGFLHLSWHPPKLSMSLMIT